MKFFQIPLSILLLLLSTSVFSQLQVDNTITPEEMVEMLVGAGVEYSNVTFSGDLNQFGTFIQNGANIDMPDGLMMGTGDVEFGIGPDDTGSGSLGGGNFGASDVDLNLLSGVDTHDAAILEFDFIPTGDFLSFEYVFASEEYFDFVCGTVNDAFGFFISGPGISGVYSSPVGFPDGSTNIALIPGTDIGVSINTVNNGVSNFDEINCSSLDPNWQDNIIYFNGNEGGPSIQYDGLTVVLEAQSTVQCGELYHIKLAIADGGDTAWDSGVFIEANSFQAEFTQISANPSTEGSIFYNNDTILVEGCNVGSFLFTRGDTIGMDTINFEVTGDVEVGDLVVEMPDFIVIPSGESSFEINVEAFADGIDEDLEELTLTYSYIIECTGDTVSTSSTLWLQDQIPPQLTATDESIFCEPIVLAPSIIEGDGPFSWSWGILPDEFTVVDTSPAISSNVTEETTYWVTVTDPCFNVDSTTITVTPQDIPPILLSGDNVAVDCPGDQVDVSVLAQDGVGNLGYLWSTGANLVSTISLNPTETQVVSVDVTDECGQLESMEFNVVVPVADPVLSAQSTSSQTPCPGTSTSLQVTAQGGFNNNPYTYLWANGSTENSTIVSPTDLGTTSYIVTVTDNCGNSVDATSTVLVTFPLPIELATDEDLCLGLTSVLSSSGGLQPLTVTTSEEVTVDINNVVSGNAPGIGVITVQDNCGQSEEVSILIHGCETVIPNIFTPGDSPGFNDTFIISGIEEFEGSKLMVFNRWGNVVFESENYDNSWKATDVAAGVYYYIFDRSDEESFSGYVEVFK